MYLKQPIQINGLTLSNRLVLPPMHTGQSPDGKVTQNQIQYYSVRAAGGAIGLIITEFSYVSLEGKATTTQMSMADDTDIESHRALVEALHREGSRVLCQINHAGGRTDTSITGMEPVAPSSIEYRLSKEVSSLPRELSVPEIQKIEEDFVQAAIRAKSAGYDGVEIHGAHGYLYNQFFSPLFNNRHDAYGRDSVENRCRIYTETIEKMRKALGKEYLIAVRFGGCDYAEGGSTLEDCAYGAALLEKAGADLLDISGGVCGPYNKGSTAPGYFQDSSRAAKAAVKAPVILTGGITKPEQAEALLQNGDADLIGVGRALLKNPDWAKNAMAES